MCQNSGGDKSVVCSVSRGRRAWGIGGGEEEVKEMRERGEGFSALPIAGAPSVAR